MESYSDYDGFDILSYRKTHLTRLHTFFVYLFISLSLLIVCLSWWAQRGYNLVVM